MIIIIMMIVGRHESLPPRPGPAATASLSAAAPDSPALAAAPAGRPV